MNVRELIEQLSTMDPEMQVIMQSDSEGNGYSPLAGSDPAGIYEEETSYSGTVYDAKWTADESGLDQEEWEEILKMPRACVLFPVN
jgi:hypothetical protein